MFRPERRRGCKASKRCGARDLRHHCAHGCLVGVFLSDERPDRSKAPQPLEFGKRRRNFSSLPPQLKQVFFVGTGRSPSGALRRYLVPAKATRLNLAVMDGYEWNNNSGSFTVTVLVERDQVDTAFVHGGYDDSVRHMGLCSGPSAVHTGPAGLGGERRRIPRDPARIVGVEHQRAGLRRVRH